MSCVEDDPVEVGVCKLTMVCAKCLVSTYIAREKEWHSAQELVRVLNLSFLGFMHRCQAKKHKTVCEAFEGHFCDKLKHTSNYTSMCTKLKYKSC